MTAPDPDLVTRLRRALDRDAAIALLARAVGTPSVTGHERAFAALLARELEAIGAEAVRLDDFAPGRPNVTAVLKGEGGGPTLMLLGHTDTVHVRGWAERWAGTEREDPFGAAIVDGAMWGRGTGDPKAGICTAVASAALGAWPVSLVTIATAMSLPRPRTLLIASVLVLAMVASAWASLAASSASVAWRCASLALAPVSRAVWAMPWAFLRASARAFS